MNHPALRVALLTAGGYPYRRDGLSSWCRLLVGALDDHEFHLRTLVDTRTGPPPYPLPANAASAEAVVVGPGARRPGTAGAAEAGVAAVLLCRGLLGDERHGAAMVTDALRRLARLAADDPDPLRDVALAEILLDAWRTSRAADAGNDRIPPPRLGVGDAATAAALLRHACRALAVRLPAVDVAHCVGGTAPLLAALAAHWRDGTPLLVTEARTPLEQRPGEQRLAPPVRAALRLFRRAVSRTGYAEAALVAPMSAHHRGWILRHGAHPATIVTVPPAADPARHPATPELMAGPSLAWAGTRPGPEVHLLLEAFAGVLGAVPGCTLRLLCPDAERGRLRELVQQAGLAAAVRVDAGGDPRRVYAAGQVIVHLPGPDEPPQRIVEAMLAGRAVVGVDTGPVAELLGDTGVVVPRDSPADLAAACVALLTDPDRRAALAAAARERARSRYTPAHLARAYRALYEDAAAPPVRTEPRHEFDLVLPAPLVPVPATVRWLAREPS
ncbi:DUF3492 domain-containing protein [Spirilliplanes yamanashiensis]|uniref:DUF3492 domain-containing protein n=1 Tax=Spirilliplanes yamanashiensis TaxID=42233 RepID=A0A8J3Y4X7_9ACTN|nr:DUF3492 domain-containing protein [Spirilliplanes yamanashiensis]MDP9819732.1 glycosyltransferase involved in cell wall biosynthesis [Spirilliplanes yamanashiensis]GIJ01448.1 hypothetical protein Sya03_08000 [Spirilliplanes yamanashiensis]